MQLYDNRIPMCVGGGGLFAVETKISWRKKGTFKKTLVLKAYCMRLKTLISKLPSKEQRAVSAEI